MQADFRTARQLQSRSCTGRPNTPYLRLQRAYDHLPASLLFSSLRRVWPYRWLGRDSLGGIPRGRPIRPPPALVHFGEYHPHLVCAQLVGQELEGILVFFPYFELAGAARYRRLLSILDDQIDGRV